MWLLWESKAHQDASWCNRIEIFPNLNWIEILLDNNRIRIAKLQLCCRPPWTALEHQRVKSQSDCNPLSIVQPVSPEDNAVQWRSVHSTYLILKFQNDLALRGLFVFFSFSKQQSVFQIHNHHHSPQAGCRLQNSRGQLTGGSVGVCHNEHQNSTYSTHDNKASRWYRWRRPTGPSRCVYSEPPTGWPSHTLLGNWGVNLWHGSSNQIE